MNTFEQVQTIIHTHLPASGGIRALHEADRLAELGITSMLVISIILEAAERMALNLEFLEESGEPPTTIGDLVAMLTRLQERNS
jgi:hypothetical protein